MAIIKITKASNGAMIRIHNDCMVAHGSDAEREVIEAQRTAAYRILMNQKKLASHLGGKGLPFDFILPFERPRR